MKRFIAAALALTLLGAGAAEARPGDGNGRGRDNQYEQRGRGADRAWQPGDGRGQPNRGWSRGQRLPGGYHGQGVDYRSERLRRPPAGYRWVRVGNDYVLMATSTGMIMEVIKGY